MVRADAHGDAPAAAEIDQRLEGFVDAGEFLLVLLVGVLDDGEFLFVGEVARINADLLDPLGRFHGGIGLEVDVGHDGDVTPGGDKLGLDVLEIGGVLDGGRGDADEFATDLDQLERLLHTLPGIHGVASEHGLDTDGIGPTHADVADLDLAGDAALIVVWIVAIGDGRHEARSLESNGLRGKRKKEVAISEEMSEFPLYLRFGIG